jgi:hypothetical protein
MKSVPHVTLSKRAAAAFYERQWCDVDEQQSPTPNRQKFAKRAHATKLTDLKFKVA